MPSPVSQRSRAPTTTPTRATPARQHEHVSDRENSVWDAAYPGQADQILAQLRGSCEPEPHEPFTEPENTPNPSIIEQLLRAVAESWLAAGMLAGHDA
jgi:hypothetical protein